MVAILDSDGQFCGGTLVASKYVISAAHCMFTDEKGENPYTASQLKVDIMFFNIQRIKYGVMEIY